jgi:mono/diheme cytochrome c family protein
MVLVSAALFGCTRGRPSSKPPIHLNPNMDVQPKVERQSPSNFFVDGAGMRMPVEGTVARGQLRDDPVYYTGKDTKGKPVKESPVPYTMAVLRRGRERFDIYCAPCHGRVGDAQSMVVKRGFVPPPTNLHDPRLLTIEDGHLFDVISNGIRNMPSYASQIPVADRWAIVAYVRALQKSQQATMKEIPPEVRKTLKGQ